jgi:hypothetical protein
LILLEQEHYERQRYQPAYENETSGARAKHGGPGEFQAKEIVTGVLNEPEVTEESALQKM